MGRRFVKQPLTSSFSTTIELKDGTEVDVEVEYSYSPSTPDVMYLSNGDPGYPGDPEECEILSVKLDEKNGRVLGEDEIDEKTYERLTEQISEEARNEAEGRYEDAMEAKADAAREREWDD